MQRYDVLLALGTREVLRYFLAGRSPDNDLQSIFSAPPIRKLQGKNSKPL